MKHMCRSLGSEIYDMAWSPDGVFFITGSMDNIARIYNAQTGGYNNRVVCPWSLSPLCRSNHTASCGAQPLRPGRSLGSAQRIRSNAIVRSLGAHLRSSIEGRAFLAAQQDHEDGSARSTNLQQQSGASRLRRSSTVCRRSFSPRHWLADTVSSGDPQLSCFAHEPATTNISQSPLVVWNLAFFTSFSVSSPITTVTSRDAVHITKHTCRTGCSKC